MTAQFNELIAVRCLDVFELLWVNAPLTAASAAAGDFITVCLEPAFTTPMTRCSMRYMVNLTNLFCCVIILLDTQVAKGFLMIFSCHAAYPPIKYLYIDETMEWHRK